MQQPPKLKPVSFETEDGTPSTKMIACEICGKEVPDSEQFAMSISYNMPGPGKAAYACPSFHHTACCHDHAEQAAVACLIEHIRIGDHA